MSGATIAGALGDSSSEGEDEVDGIRGTQTGGSKSMDVEQPAGRNTFALVFYGEYASLADAIKEFKIPKDVALFLTSLDEDAEDGTVAWVSKLMSSIEGANKTRRFLVRKTKPPSPYTRAVAKAYIGLFHTLTAEECGFGQALSKSGRIYETAVLKEAPLAFTTPSMLYVATHNASNSPNVERTLRGFCKGSTAVAACQFYLLCKRRVNSKSDVIKAFMEESGTAYEERRKTTDVTETGGRKRPGDYLHNSRGGKAQRIDSAGQQHQHADADVEIVEDDQRYTMHAAASEYIYNEQYENAAQQIQPLLQAAQQVNILRDQAQHQVPADAQVVPAAAAAWEAGDNDDEPDDTDAPMGSADLALAPVHAAAAGPVDDDQDQPPRAVVNHPHFSPQEVAFLNQLDIGLPGQGGAPQGMTFLEWFRHVVIPRLQLARNVNVRLQTDLDIANRVIDSQRDTIGRSQRASGQASTQNANNSKRISELEGELRAVNRRHAEELLNLRSVHEANLRAVNDRHAEQLRQLGNAQGGADFLKIYKDALETTRADYAQGIKLASEQRANFTELLNAQTARAVAAESERNNLQSRVNELSLAAGSKQAAEALAAERLAQLTITRDELKTAREQLSADTLQRKRVEVELDVIKTRNPIDNAEIKRLTEQLARSEAKLSTVTAALEEKKSEMKDCEKAKKDLSLAKIRSETAERKAADATARSEHLSHEIGQTRELLENARQALAKAKTDLETCRDERARLKRILDEQKHETKDCDAVRAKLKKADEQLANLRAEKSAADKRVRDLETENTKLNGKLSSLAGAKDVRSVLEARIKTLEEQLKEAKSDDTRMRNADAKEEESLSALRTKVSRLEAEKTLAEHAAAKKVEAELSNANDNAQRFEESYKEAVRLLNVVKKSINAVAHMDVDQVDGVVTVDAEPMDVDEGKRAHINADFTSQVEHAMDRIRSYAAVANEASAKLASADEKLQDIQKLTVNANNAFRGVIHYVDAEHAEALNSVNDPVALAKQLVMVLRRQIGVAIDMTDDGMEVDLVNGQETTLVAHMKGIVEEEFVDLLRDLIIRISPDFYVAEEVADKTDVKSAVDAFNKLAREELRISAQFVEDAELERANPGAMAAIRVPGRYTISTSAADGDEKSSTDLVLERRITGALRHQVATLQSQLDLAKTRGSECGDRATRLKKILDEKIKELDDAEKLAERNRKAAMEAEDAKRQVELLRSTDRSNGARDRFVATYGREIQEFATRRKHKAMQMAVIRPTADGLFYRPPSVPRFINSQAFGGSEFFKAEVAALGMFPHSVSTMASTFSGMVRMAVEQRIPVHVFGDRIHDLPLTPNSADQLYPVGSPWRPAFSRVSVNQKPGGQPQLFPSYPNQPLFVAVSADTDFGELFTKIRKTITDRNMFVSGTSVNVYLVATDDKPVGVTSASLAGASAFAPATDLDIGGFTIPSQPEPITFHFAGGITVADTPEVEAIALLSAIASNQPPSVAEKIVKMCTSSGSKTEAALELITREHAAIKEAMTMNLGLEEDDVRRHAFDHCWNLVAAGPVSEGVTTAGAMVVTGSYDATPHPPVVARIKI